MKVITKQLSVKERFNEDITDIERKVLDSFSKNGVKYFPSRFAKTLKFTARKHLLNKKDFGIYDPKTQILEPLSEQEWEKILSKSNFTRVYLHAYNTENNRSDFLMEVESKKVYVFEGDIYSEGLLHSFIALYRYDHLEYLVVQRLAEDLSKKYNIETRSYVWEEFGSPVLFFKEKEGENYRNIINAYNIRLSLDSVLPEIVESLDFEKTSEEYSKVKDLSIIEDINESLFNGNEETYNFLKKFSSRKVSDLKPVLNCTDFNLEKMVYILEHDSDYTNTHAFVIDFADYEENLRTIKKFLDEIDERFYSMCGIHILKKTKEKK